MLALTGMIIAGGMGLSSNLKAGGDSSINFDKTKYKLGDKATGKWKVDDGFQIVDSKSTENLSKPNIPHKNGPGSGTFEVNTLKYSNSVNDAKVFMMLKDKNTGISEKENNALRASCTIITFIGYLSASTIRKGEYDKVKVKIKGTGHPAALGKISGEVTPNDPSFPQSQTFLSSTNNIDWESAIFEASGQHTFIGTKFTANLSYGGFSFVANANLQGIVHHSISFR